AGSRLLVQRDVHDAVVNGLVQMAQAFRTGDGFDANAVMGPLISSKQMARVDELVRGGADAGARIVCGGRRSGGQGWFYEPTVMTGAEPSMRIASEEIFGPVLSVIPFDTAEEALAIANDTAYGLSSYVWTQDISK